MKAMELSANELRIGNLFYYHGVPANVLEIKRNGVEFGYYVDSVGFYREYSSDDFPRCILLTEEWLLKLGFHKIAEDDFDKTFGIGQISIRKSKLYISDKSGVYLNQKRIAIIQYVHQLQNLYFALTGQELKTK